MHKNSCYVKLALAGLAAVLLPSVAHAEVVPGQPGFAVLATSASGTPTVASLDERSLIVTTRAASGWRPVRLALPVPASEAFVVAARVDGAGRPVVLVEDLVRRTLVVAWRRPSRWRILAVAHLQAANQLGVAGLALERRGTPVVAYAFRRPTGKTFLRLVRIETNGRVVSSPVTQRGFPDSSGPPSAAPHLTPAGIVRVVEAFSAGVIDWFRDDGKWTGQFLFATEMGAPVGRVLALPGPRGAVVAWTQDYPAFGETHVLLQEGPATGEVTDVFSHAHLAALTVAAGRPEVAGNDWVELDGWTTFAGLLSFLDGPPVELDGRVEAYLAVAGSRQLLLATDRGLEWFRIARPSIRVSFAVDASANASGHIDGATTGAVAIYREDAATGRVLLATVQIGADGSFAAHLSPSPSPTLYRAVYRDPATGVPYASLLR